MSKSRVATLLNIQDDLSEIQPVAEQATSISQADIREKTEQIKSEWCTSYQSIMRNADFLTSAYEKKIVDIEEKHKNNFIFKEVLKYLTLFEYKYTLQPVIDHLADNYCKLLVADTEKSLEKNLDPSIDRWSMAYASLFNNNLHENSELHSDALNKLTLFSGKTVDDYLENHLRLSDEECSQKIKEYNDELERYEQDLTATAVCAGSDLSMR